MIYVELVDSSQLVLILIGGINYANAATLLGHDHIFMKKLEGNLDKFSQPCSYSGF